MGTETTPDTATAPTWTSFETHPDRYRHWKLKIAGRSRMNKRELLAAVNRKRGS